MERKISHQALEKSFIEAIRAAMPMTDIKVQPSGNEIPDIVIETGGQRVFVETSNLRYPSDIIRSIYRIVGYVSLTDERFDSFYIVIPKDALSSSTVKETLDDARRRLHEKIGIVTYSLIDSTITYEVAEPGMGQLPDKFAASFSMPQRTVSRVSLSSPKALRILRQVLLKDKTTQFDISRQIGVSIGHVNKVISYLRDQEILTYKRRNLILLEPWRLLNEISWSRSMQSLKLADLYLSDGGGSVEEAEWTLRKICEEEKVPYAFTLFSAARRYSAYIKKYDSVHMYVDEYEQYRKYFLEGGLRDGGRGIRVEIFQPDSEDILKDSKSIQGFIICSEIQTVIDLACYGEMGRELAVEIYSKIRGAES